MTLIDVAKVAGVSPITVSRALNRPDVVSESARKKVLEAVRVTGYVPNMLAGGLASNKSRLVAIFVPTIAHSIFAETVQSLMDHLTAAGYQTMIGLTGYSAEQEERLLGAVLGRRPDGIVLTGTLHTEQSRLRLQAQPALLGVQRTGQHDAVGAPPEHRAEQALLLLGGVAGEADHGLVAGGGQMIHQRLHRLGEDRVRDGRHEDGHQPTLVRGQAARQHVGHIAGHPHRFEDFLAGTLADHVGSVQRTGHGDRRNPRHLGHVDQRHARALARWRAGR